MPRMAALLAVMVLAATVARSDEQPEAAAPIAPAELAPAVEGAEGNPLEDPWAALEVAAPGAKARPLERDGGRGGAADGAQRADVSAVGPWVRTTMALGGVVVLIVFLGWGYRRVADNRGAWPFAARPRSATMMEVLGRTTISPRQSVVLMRVGPRLVLVGCTADAIRPLDVISDPEQVSRMLGHVAQQRADSQSAEFAQCLERESGSYGGEDESHHETVMPEEARLGELKAKLHGTLERLRSVGVNA